MEKRKLSHVTFLDGGGEMGERICSFAWEKSPLGPIESWPQSLKTACGLMLNSQHPIWIGWGPEATFLYNDAYVDVLSLAKHPGALGKPTAEVWAEIWDICGPLADKVFKKGEASYLNDVRLFMNRKEFLEETFYSFSYSPIRDEAGNVGGLFCPSTEVSSKVLHTRRLRVLSELAAHSMAEKSTANACASAAAIIATARDDIPFALLYLIDPQADVALLEQTTAMPINAGDITPRRVELGDPGAAKEFWPLAQVFRTSMPEVVSIKGIAGFPTGAADQSLREAFVLPIVSRGQERPLGVMVAGVNPTRRLDPDYRNFFEMVADHVASAILNARAVEEEKRRLDMLAELDRAKTTFFSNVSHELRTPLTLILGPLEDGMRETSEPPEWLELAHRNSLRLLKLVNTLLDFSRIEADRIEASFQPTDLAAFTAELAGVFRSGIERAGLRLVLNCAPLPEPVYVDREMWEKIVFNLLSNALKFTAQGEIEVKLERNPGGKTVCLSVRDTGIGIQEDELPKVFERFHRVKTKWARSQEGTGIGLALVQELARLHGGEVQVKSREGHGTIFTVSIPSGFEHLPRERITAARTMASTRSGALPFVEEAQRWLPAEADHLTSSLSLSSKLTGAASPGASNGKSRHSGSRIVLADDNSDMRNYVSRLLAGEGYEVVAVSDGEAALEAITSQATSLVLSDVMMPRLDGFALLSKLRSDPATKSIPIILLSARAGEESRVEGVEAGADDYLVKPFSARELLARVKTHLELARVRREAQEKLSAAHDRLQTVLSSISDGLVVFDKEWRYTYLSEQAARILGRSADELLGRCVWDMFPKAKGTKFYESHLEAVETGRMVQIEEYYPEPLNKWLECHCYPSDLGLSVYFHDITERKRAEEALREAHAQLADKATHLESLIQQRTAKLSETIGDLEAFSYSIAHDMRAPLRSLQGFSHILVSQYEGALDDEGRDYLKRIATSAARMDKLIQDVLNYSRVIRNDLPLEEVDVSGLLESIVETYPGLGDDKASIKVHKPLPIVLGNEAMLTQVFSNLLGNAVKFVAAGVKPRIQIWAEPNDSRVRLFVRDNGIGIERDQQQKIFDIFQQVEKGSDSTGIGLAIVKKAIERMGGIVGVQSDLGHGSTFWIELNLPAEGRP